MPPGSSSSASVKIAFSIEGLHDAVSALETLKKASDAINATSVTTGGSDATFNRTKLELKRAIIARRIRNNRLLIEPSWNQNQSTLSA